MSSERIINYPLGLRLLPALRAVLRHCSFITKCPCEQAFCSKLKAIPHNFKCDICEEILLSNKLMQYLIFRQMKQKTQLILCVSASIFVIYDGKDSSKIVLKVSAANCAVLP